VLLGQRSGGELPIPTRLNCNVERPWIRIIISAQPTETVKKSIPSLPNETEREVTNETNTLGADPSP